MDSHLRADGLAPLVVGWSALPVRGDEDVPNDGCDVSPLAGGVAIDARRSYECPHLHTVRESPYHTERWENRIDTSRDLGDGIDPDVLPPEQFLE
jgi:hypothetical protein